MRRFMLAPLLVLATPPMLLAQATSTPTDPVAVVREYIAAQNRGDVDRMLTLVGDPVEIRAGLTTAVLTSSALSENRMQLRTRFTRMIEGCPGAHSEILEVLTEGSVVVVKERMTGLPGGVSATGLTMYRVRNGKIESMWVVSSSSSAGDK
jgi:hypothetical protein